MALSYFIQTDSGALQIPFETLLLQDYRPIAKAAAIVILGLPIVYSLARLGRRVVADRFSPQRGLVIQKLVLYPGLLLLAVSVMTEMGKAMVKRIPQRRIGVLQDLNGPLLLLASEAGALMTGAALTVDGGHVLSSL